MSVQNQQIYRPSDSNKNIDIYINFREYRMGNHKWTIQRKWQQDGEKNKSKNTTQYVFDTTIQQRKPK